MANCNKTPYYGRDERDAALATSAKLDSVNAVLVHENELQETETIDTIDTILVPKTVNLMPTAAQDVP